MVMSISFPLFLVERDLRSNVYLLQEFLSHRPYFRLAGEYGVESIDLCVFVSLVHL